MDSLHNDPPQIKLIAGLGNPGPAYRDTRHNLGFRVVDRLAERFKIAWQPGISDLLVSRRGLKDRDLYLLKPQGYMNRSGPPIEAFLKDFCILPGEILVIHDDIDLEFGRLKIKAKGGDGGHRGVRSLIDALETGDFARLRLGIGRAEADDDVVDHVLGQFDDREKQHLAAFIDQASEAAVTVLEKGVNTAMNRFNRKSIMKS